ncbi:MAG: restriction endonuclease subunit S [Treponema sp.]|nr:restriction endonuclease subunit S [Treponema sp.]
MFGSGDIPYVTASEMNNSIVSYISYKESMMEEGNSIMIGGKTLVITYQPDNFFSNDSHNLILYLKQSEKRTELIQLFLVACLYHRLKPIYSWGDSISYQKIQSDIITLPTTKLGEIDFEYMENYIQKILNDNLQIVDSFLKENNLSSFVLTPSEKKAVEDFVNRKINTKDYKIASIFNIYSPPKRFNANAIEFGGKYPYVARGSENNGIRGFTSQNIQYLSKGNTISFGQDTATIYYQRLPYFTGDKIKVMELTDSELNENRAIYLISAMRKSFSTFAWGISSFNEDVLNNVIIRLPVTKSNEIDYSFMENYISAQKKLAILTIIKTPEIEQNKREYDIEKKYGIMNVADKKDNYE